MYFGHVITDRQGADQSMNFNRSMPKTSHNTRESSTEPTNRKDSSRREFPNYSFEEIAEFRELSTGRVEANPKSAFLTAGAAHRSGEELIKTRLETFVPMGKLSNIGLTGKCMRIIQFRLQEIR